MLEKMFGILLLLYLAPIVSAKLDPDLIKEYFKYKNVDYGSVYGCFDHKEQIALSKTLISSNLSLSIYNIKDAEFNINDTNVFLKYNRHLGIAFDGDCQYADQFLKQANLCKTFTEVHHWVVFMQKDEIEEKFGSLNQLTVSTDLKVAIPHYVDDNLVSWMIYDVYNQAGFLGGSLKTRFYNVFRYGQPIARWHKKDNLYWERRNMSGVTFRTMVVLPKDYPGNLHDYLQFDGDRQVNTFNRFHSVLVYHMQDFYNFSMNISETKSWGYKMHNNTFDGLVRALEDKEMDFGMSPLFVKTERWPVVDYGRRTWLLRSAFIFRIPKRPASFEVFLRPLDGLVWSVTVSAAIVIILLLKLATKFEIKMMVDAMLPFESSWSFLSLFTFGALFQQGAADCPNSISGRILVIYVFIFAVLLYQFYSASIVSILLMTPARIIKDLRDLAYSTLTLGVEDVLYNRDYIGKLQFDPVVSLLERKAPEKGNITFYVEPEIGLKLVAQGGYAFHVEVATAYPIIKETFDEDTICSLDEVQLFQTQQMHQPLQKYSPFTELLDYALQRMDEAGLIRRQIHHWNEPKPECIRSQPPTSQVSIEEFYPALSMLLFGILISITILVIEYIIKIRQDRLYQVKLRKKILAAPKPVFPKY